MTMAGMLTPAQIKELDAAKGVEFDRAYLRLMIQHHAGALKMVDDLFAAPLAGQEVDVNVFANDVVTAQTVEIGIMQKLLTSSPRSEPPLQLPVPLPHTGVRPDAQFKQADRPHRDPRRAGALVGADLSERRRSAEQPQAGPASTPASRRATCASCRSRRSRRSSTPCAA